MAVVTVVLMFLSGISAVFYSLLHTWDHPILGACCLGLAVFFGLGAIDDRLMLVANANAEALDHLGNRLSRKSVDGEDQENGEDQEIE